MPQTNGYCLLDKRLAQKTNCLVEKTNCLLCLRFRPSEFRRRHPEFRLETAVERDRIGEAAGLTHLLNGHFRLLVEETDGMVEAQLANECGKPLVAARLSESGSNAFLRQTRTADERLSVEVRIEEHLLALDEIVEVIEEVGVG